MKMWGQMSDYGGGGGMGVGMLLFWGLLIVGIVMLVRYCIGSGSCGRRNEGKSALDIIKERYARGEIGSEEFEQKKRDLSE
jgi:putative membrane protein